MPGVPVFRIIYLKVILKSNSNNNVELDNKDFDDIYSHSRGPSSLLL